MRTYASREKFRSKRSTASKLLVASAPRLRTTAVAKWPCSLFWRRRGYPRPSEEPSPRVMLSPKAMYLGWFLPMAAAAGGREPSPAGTAP